MRYWFTSDGSTALPVVACYYATFGCGNIQQSAVDLPDRLEKADHYAEISFTTGSLAPGESASLDQLAIRDTGGATYGRQRSQLPRPGPLSRTTTGHGYVGGELVWGTEPKPLAGVRVRRGAVLEPRAGPAGQRARAGLKVINTGTVDLDPARLGTSGTGSRPRTPHPGAEGSVTTRTPAAEGQHDLRTGRRRHARGRHLLEVAFAAGTFRPGPHRVRSSSRPQVRLLELRRANDYSHGTNTTFASEPRGHRVPRRRTRLGDRP